VNRTVDALQRATLIEDGSGTDIVAPEYLGGGGRLKKLTFGNGTKSEHGYDGFRRLTDLDHKTSGSTTFAGFDMAYDKVGNLNYEEWSHDSGKGHNYSYDKAYRLKSSLQNCNDPSAEYASPGSQTYVKKLEYNLSDDSDRTSVVTTPYGGSAATVSYTANLTHAYTVVGGVNRSHDLNGNVTDDGTYTFAYDYRNQLVKATRKSDSVVVGEYEFDALGRRTKKTLAGGATVRWYHDGELEIEEFDGSTLLRKFVFRESIRSIAMMEAADVADVDDDTNTTELVRLFYHLDARTNVSRLTAAAQTVVESYSYAPFGEHAVFNRLGAGVSTSPTTNSIGFQSCRLDEEVQALYGDSSNYDYSRASLLQGAHCSFGLPAVAATMPAQAAPVQWETVPKKAKWQLKSVSVWGFWFVWIPWLEFDASWTEEWHFDLILGRVGMDDVPPPKARNGGTVSPPNKYEIRDKAGDLKETRIIYELKYDIKFACGVVHCTVLVIHIFKHYYGGGFSGKGRLGLQPRKTQNLKDLLHATFDSGVVDALAEVWDATGVSEVSGEVGRNAVAVGIKWSPDGILSRTGPARYEVVGSARAEFGGSGAVSGSLFLGIQVNF
jgi:hypothetical protein